jgi:hypothetical protein
MAISAEGSPARPYFGDRENRPTTTNASDPVGTAVAAAETRAAVARVAATDTSTGEALAIRVAAGQRQIGG